jgi:hypothetical protein
MRKRLTLPKHEHPILVCVGCSDTPHASETARTEHLLT